MRGEEGVAGQANINIKEKEKGTKASVLQNYVSITVICEGSQKRYCQA